MTATLYGVNVSPFVRKVRIVMAEKGLDYEHVSVNPMRPPDAYREISPLGKIPAYTDGDKTLADSSVICAYIDAQHPEPPLYPADAYERACACWIEEFIDSGFTPKAGPNVFFPLVVAPAMMDRPVTDEVRAGVDKAIAEELTPMWSYLEGEISGKDYFVANRFTIADLTVASIHLNLYLAGVDIEAQKFPALSSFVERMLARPSVKALLDEETPMWSQRNDG